MLSRSIRVAAALAAVLALAALCVAPAMAAPPNDDFAAALPLLGTATEEPQGARQYHASAVGDNSGATKEADEPDHGEDPGGASVWYSWTAPESGMARIGACCQGPPLVSVYEGGSLTALEEIDRVGSPSTGGYPVLAGTTYRIAVDGPYDEESEAAQTGRFQLVVFMLLAPGPGYPILLPAPPSPPPPADTDPPRTKIAKRKILHRERRAVFWLRSSEAGSRFRCKLDRRRFRSCGRRVALRKLRPGRHVLRVYAIDAAGNRDRSSAVARFRIRAG